MEDSILISLTENNKTFFCHCAMNTRTVYRIESREKKGRFYWNQLNMVNVGPYGDDDFGCDLGYAHGNLEFPCFTQDGISSSDKFTSMYCAGFSTYEQLTKWFNGWGRMMSEADYVIATYQVEEDFVIHGKSGKQLAFDQEKAKRISADEIDFE